MECMMLSLESSLRAERSNPGAKRTILCLAPGLLPATPNGSAVASRRYTPRNDLTWMHP
jgi:hypothetical protein